MHFSDLFFHVWGVSVGVFSMFVFQNMLPVVEYRHRHETNSHAIIDVKKKKWNIADRR